VNRARITQAVAMQTWPARSRALAQAHAFLHVQLFPRVRLDLRQIDIAPLGAFSNACQKALIRWRPRESRTFARASGIWLLRATRSLKFLSLFHERARAPIGVHQRRAHPSTEVTAL
jgi:hypothetical protein